MEPRVKADEPVASPKITLASAPPSVRAVHGRRVLFVDDDPLCRQTFERLLRARGFDVDVAASADEAIAYARRRQYEVVVCDLVLPRLDGVEVIQRLRPIQSDARYVMTTGLDRLQADPAIARAGIDGTLFKPWDTSELASTVERLAARTNPRMPSEAPLERIVGDVLVIQDEGAEFAPLERALREALPPYGRVLRARSLGDAAKCLREQPVGLVLFELTPPHAQGLDWLVRLHDLGHEAPIVVIGDASDDAWMTHAVQAGAQEYVRKQDLSGRALSRAVRHAIERKRSELRLTRVALYDQLTGAANRTLFSRRLEAALDDARAHARRFGLLFVDVDHFKEVNDQLGHEMGDALLSAFAMRLSDCLVPGELLARLGGDEFAVLSEHVESHELARALARRISHALRAPFELDGHSLKIGASVGIAVYPEDGKDTKQLLRTADTDMYRWKGHRRRARQQAAAAASALGRDPLEDALRPALERGEFVPYFQPVMCLATGSAVITEALLRWRRPQQGLLHPDAFLSLLDGTGMIIPVGRKVLDDGLMELTGLRRHAASMLRLSLNVTAAQVADRGFVTDVLHLLEAHAHAPSALELELSESVISARSEAISDALATLAREGVRVCIDDFGTGLSSLTMLRRAPVHAVKIDRTLVRDLVPSIEGRAVVSAIIALGRGLGLTVIAEGVENEAQERILRDLGCELAQGLHYAAPMPADTLATWLQG